MLHTYASDEAASYNFSSSVHRQLGGAITTFKRALVLHLHPQQTEGLGLRDSLIFGQWRMWHQINVLFVYYRDLNHPARVPLLLRFCKTGTGLNTMVREEQGHCKMNWNALCSWRWPAGYDFWEMQMSDPYKNEILPQLKVKSEIILIQTYVRVCVCVCVCVYNTAVFIEAPIEQ